MSDHLGDVALNDVSLEVQSRRDPPASPALPVTARKELKPGIDGNLRPVASGQRQVGRKGLHRQKRRRIRLPWASAISPEDRLHSGLAPCAQRVTDNAVIREYKKPPVSVGSWISGRVLQPRSPRPLPRPHRSQSPISACPCAICQAATSKAGRPPPEGMRIAGEVLITPSIRAAALTSAPSTP